MRKFYVILALFLFSAHVNAQFSGNYAPAKWTQALSAGSNGSVNTASAPTSITITGSDDPTRSYVALTNVDYTAKTMADGVWSFSWTYHTTDAPNADVAGVLINGAFFQLSNNSGGSDQSGSYTSGSLPAGTIIGFRVSSTDNVWGAASMKITNFSAPGATLPLKLLSFKASPAPGRINLNWNTAAEINTSSFEVQRSTDGTTFRVIGTIAAGQPSGQYSFADAKPEPGTVFYRLRMIDVDGHFTFSGVVSVPFETGTNLQVSPNPSNGHTEVVVFSKSPVAERLQVVDAAGNCILSEPWILVSGNNKKRLNLYSHPAGMYFIRLGAVGKTQMLILE